MAGALIPYCRCTTRSATSPDTRRHGRSMNGELVFKAKTSKKWQLIRCPRGTKCPRGKHNPELPARQLETPEIEKLNHGSRLTFKCWSYRDRPNDLMHVLRPPVEAAAHSCPPSVFQRVSASGLIPLKNPALNNELNSARHRITVAAQYQLEGNRPSVHRAKSCTCYPICYPGQSWVSDYLRGKVLESGSACWAQLATTLQRPND